MVALYNGAGLAAFALLAAACGPREPSGQSEEAVNFDVVDNSSGEGTFAGTFESSDYEDPSAADIAVNLGDSAAEGDSSERETSQVKVWVGMSGIPQGCTLTNYHGLQDVQVVMQNDNAIVLEKTPNLIIFRKSAPKGQYKLVYTTDEALCEVVVTRASFMESADSDAAQEEAETGND